MRLSAFWACVRLISSTIGSLPLPVFTVDDRGVRRAARDNPLYKVLHESPNADQTPVDYWEFAAISLLLRDLARRYPDADAEVRRKPPQSIKDDPGLFEEEDAALKNG